MRDATMKKKVRTSVVRSEIKKGERKEKEGGIKVETHNFFLDIWLHHA